MDKIALIEKQWREQSFVPLNLLFDTFPEAVPIVERNMVKVEVQINGMKNLVVKRIKEIKESVPTQNQWLAKAIFKHTSPLIKQLKELNNRKKRLKMYQNHYRNKGSLGLDMNLAIYNAKQVSLEKLVLPNVSRFKQSGRRIMASCPFHTESTPSFCIYLDENKYYCFGCHSHGNAITFVIKYYGMTFLEAIKYLQGY
jgi:hypothetical protein